MQQSVISQISLSNLINVTPAVGVLCVCNILSKKTDSCTYSKGPHVITDTQLFFVNIFVNKMRTVFKKAIRLAAELQTLTLRINLFSPPQSWGLKNLINPLAYMFYNNFLWLYIGTADNRQETGWERRQQHRARGHGSGLNPGLLQRGHGHTWGARSTCRKSISLFLLGPKDFKDQKSH